MRMPWDVPCACRCTGETSDWHSTRERSDVCNTRQSGLRVELYEVHWVLTAPGIVQTVIVASTGWLSGLCGPRTLYLIAVASMTLGSLGGMLAWDWPALVGFRILAGIGGGMLPQFSQAIFYQIFPPGQRGMALGIDTADIHLGEGRERPPLAAATLAHPEWRGSPADAPRSTAGHGAVQPGQAAPEGREEGHGEPAYTVGLMFWLSRNRFVGS